MAGEWKTSSLDELLEDVLDRRGVTPLKLGSDFTNEGHRVISAKLMKNGRIDLTADDARFVDSETYKRWMKTPLLPDDVILTSEAPLGEVAYIQTELEWCLGQRLFGLRTKKDRLHGRFLYYALLSESVRHDLLSRATGTVAQGIRQTELLKVRLPEPPIDKQRAIAHILGTLDDKIELNRLMNETLEAIARAMFKSWFVDFDPVRAKMNGEPPESIYQRLGLTPDLLALFPDHLVDSQLGEIPEGWEVHGLDSIAALITKSVSPSAQPNEVFEHYSIPAFDTGVIPAYELGATIKSNKYVVSPNAVLVSKLNPETQRIWLPAVKTVRAVCSTEFMQFEPQFDCVRSYLYLLMKSEAMQEEILKRVTGSTGSRQRAQPSQIATLPIIVPVEKVVKAFDLLIKPMLSHAIANLNQSQTLENLRDSLLPKLLSGELRVPVIEGAVL